jgi:predicted N-acetyltransferase YhbS
LAACDCGDVVADGRSLLLLGPLAVEATSGGKGIGSGLMRHAIIRAEARGHGGVILVGDASYYQRFGFSSEKTGALMMPGPVERHRLLGLEIKPGYLDELAGLLVASGQRIAAPEQRGQSRRAESCLKSRFFSIPQGVHRW